MDEDALLTQIAIDSALALEHPADREMILMVFRIEVPSDYAGPWPPKYEDIGRHIGSKYEGAPLSEAAIRYRRDVMLAKWQGLRGRLRRGRGK